MKQLNNDYNNNQQQVPQQRVLTGNKFHQFMSKYKKFIMPVILCIIMILIVMGIGLVLKHV